MKNYRSKIYLFLYVSLVIVLGSFAILFVNFRKQVGLQNKILVIENNLIQADSLINNLLQIEADKRGFQLTSDVTYLKNFYRIKTGCRASIEKLKANSMEKKDLLFIARIDSMVSVCLSNLENCIVVYRTEGAIAATAYMQEPDKRNIREILGDDLATLKNRFQQQLQTITLGINQRGSRNVAGLLMLLLVFVILMLVAARTFRRAQKKMIKNHYKFKDAQRIAKIGSWEWDFATNRIKWSQEQFRLFGEQRGEFDLSFDSYLSHLAPEERNRTQGLFGAAISGQTGFSVEHEIIRKDGTKLMVFEQGTVLYDEKTGEPVGMFGTTQDITAQKKAEKELLEAQQKFQAIFDNTADGIYQSTVDGQFIMLNASMARIFGYETPGDMLRSVTNIGHQLYADPAERRAMADLIARQGHVEDYEIRVITKTKEVIWVSANIRLVEDEKGLTNYFEGTLEDISERKRSEEQLLDLSKRLQLAAKATGIGIWDWDIINRSTIWDEDMFRIYDTVPGQAEDITRTWESLLHPEDAERVKAELDEALRGIKDYDTEFRIICSDRSIRHIKGNGLVLRDSAGNASRMIGTNTDITLRKTAEEEILQLNRNLDQFANITAHDLQEPIRMVSGFLGLLDKKYGQVIDEQGKSYILRAKDGADRMSILIRDLLEYSRSGNKAAKVEPVDLKYVLDLVHQDMEIVMDKTDATLLIPNSLPVVEGTQSALYRLFLNLVSNGIKFKKKDTAPEVRISAQDAGDHWEFSVEDNGIGVAEKDQPKLFQAFQRLHRREDYPGTGLGLVTCKKIVEMHGGRIWMTSEFGKGTTFHFTISKIPGMIAEQTIDLRRA